MYENTLALRDTESLRLVTWQSFTRAANSKCVRFFRHARFARRLHVDVYSVAHTRPPVDRNIRPTWDPIKNRRGRLSHFESHRPSVRVSPNVAHGLSTPPSVRRSNAKLFRPEHVGSHAHGVLSRDKRRLFGSSERAVVGDKLTAPAHDSYNTCIHVCLESVLLFSVEFSRLGDHHVFVLCVSAKTICIIIMTRIWC